MRERALVMARLDGCWCDCEIESSEPARNVFVMHIFHDDYCPLYDSDKRTMHVMPQPKAGK